MKSQTIAIDVTSPARYATSTQLNLLQNNSVSRVNFGDCDAVNQHFDTIENFAAAVVDGLNAIAESGAITVLVPWPQFSELFEQNSFDAIVIQLVQGIRAFKQSRPPCVENILLLISPDKGPHFGTISKHVATAFPPQPLTALPQW